MKFVKLSADPTTNMIRKDLIARIERNEKDINKIKKDLHNIRRHHQVVARESVLITECEVMLSMYISYDNILHEKLKTVNKKVAQELELMIKMNGFGNVSKIYMNQKHTDKNSYKRKWYT